MSGHPRPEEVRRATFRVVFRGFDQTEVAEFLDRAAAAVEELEAERERLTTRLGEFAERDLQSEFENVGKEVASVLEAARQAAETMRDRATGDAARWRSEAMAEADETRKDARSDAEAMRTDAWTTGTQLLDQVLAEVGRMRGEAERDALSVRGEAEREAHRLTSSARREAEDLVRTARMEAERTSTDARSEYDEIIANAHRQAESAQERTRALEERREELMTELESIRSALASFEAEAEGRNGPAPVGGAEVSPPVQRPGSHERGPDWEDGHTVRIIRPGREDEGAAAAEDREPTAEELAEEVARLHETGTAEAPAPDVLEQIPDLDEHGPDEPGEEAPSELEFPPEVAAAEPEIAAAESEVETDESGEGQESSDDVFELFRRLRQPPTAEPVGSVDAAEDETEPEDGPIPEPQEIAPEVESVPPRHSAGSDDVFALRERLLLPVTNPALRAVKRVLTDAQNEALEQIRLTEGSWVPSDESFVAAVSDDLQDLMGSAQAAGLEAAAEYGAEAGEVQPPQTSPERVEAMPRDLAVALRRSLEKSGEGPRERSAAVSRVFRGWRTDEAERRIREMALEGYHMGLTAGLEAAGTAWSWVANGRLCPQCRAASRDPGAVPPAHRDCDCGVAVEV